MKNKEFKIVSRVFNYCFLFQLNPISAGVLENQDRLGGQFEPPPPLNPMFDVQI